MRWEANLPDCDTSAPDVCNSRSLEFKASTPEYEDKEGDIDDDEAGNGKATPSARAGSDLVNPVKKSGKSEYELVRDANIARNRELIRELGLKFGWDKEQGPASESQLTQKTNRKGKAQGKQATMRLMRPSHESVPISDSRSASMAVSNTENLVTNDGKHAPAMSARQSVINTDQTIRVVSSNTPSLLAASSQPSPASESVDSAQPPSQEMAFSAPGVESTVNSASLNGTIDASPPAPLTTNHHFVPGQDTRATKLPVPPTATSLPASSTMTALPALIMTSNPESMDVDASSNGTESPLNPDSMQVDDEKRAEAPVTSSTSAVTVGPPTWLAALQMDAYLQESSDLTAWQQLVTSFYKFEKLNTINGVRISILFSSWISDNSMVQNLPTTMRPEEVASWIKSKKKNSLPEVDINTYGSSFMVWWIALQPAWRVANDSSSTTWPQVMRIGVSFRRVDRLVYTQCLLPCHGGSER